jgi:hypothetical protein
LEYGFKVAIFNNSGGKVYQLGDLCKVFYIELMVFVNLKKIFENNTLLHL